MRMTRSEFLAWPHKAITLLGMSGRRQDDARLQAAVVEVVSLLRRLPHRHEVPGRADPRQHQAPGDAGRLPARAAAQRLDLHREQHHGPQPAARVDVLGQDRPPGSRRAARRGVQAAAAAASRGRDRRDARRRRVHRQGAGDLRLRPLHQRRRRQLGRARRRADREDARRAHADSCI